MLIAVGLSAFGSGFSEHLRLEMVRDLALDHGELRCVIHS